MKMFTSLLSRSPRALGWALEHGLPAARIDAVQAELADQVRQGRVAQLDAQLAALSGADIPFSEALRDSLFRAVGRWNSADEDSLELSRLAVKHLARQSSLSRMEVEILAGSHWLDTQPRADLLGHPNLHAGGLEVFMEHQLSRDDLSPTERSKLLLHPLLADRAYLRKELGRRLNLTAEGIRLVEAAPEEGRLGRWCELIETSPWLALEVLDADEVRPWTKAPEAMKTMLASPLRALRERALRLVPEARIAPRGRGAVRCAP